MTAPPLERSYSLEAAEERLRATLDTLGYQYAFQSAGEYVQTCKCTLTDVRSGEFSASGNGKGDVDASRVGSLFEATEHLFSEYALLDATKITYANSANFCLNGVLCDTLPLALLRTDRRANIPCLKYRAVNGSGACAYPLALSCPSYIDALVSDEELQAKDAFDYGRLENYSSNSGTAIGMNEDEAIIHGLLESIERTSLSKLLRSTFLPGGGRKLRTVDPLTLPDRVADALFRILREFGKRVLIVEMPNRFGIPAYCSWIDQCEFQLGIAGFGCSLSHEHAIARSLYELAQLILLAQHIYGLDWLRNLDKDVIAQLDGLPFHQVCAKFDLGQKCTELGHETVAFDSLTKLQFSSVPRAYLTQLTEMIYSNGEVPFASQLRVFESGITVVHTFITGEDRFFNVRSGKSVFPTGLENS